MMRVLFVLLALLMAGCASDTDPRESDDRMNATPPTVPANPFEGRPQDELDGLLTKAAEDDDAAVAAQLIGAGADLESRNRLEQTPLLVASAADSVEVATVLAKAGADPDALDYRHDTPWLVTGVTGSVEMAKVLLPLQPDLTIRNRFGGISHIPASERGHDDYVAFVLDHTDIAVDHVNDLGWTALLEAVILGKGSARWQHIVQSFIDHGADVSIADRDGVTPLEHAQRSGFGEIADILRRR